MLRETTSQGLCGLVYPSRTWTLEEPGTLTQGGALFPLILLVWESNPKLQGGWCKPNHQPNGDLEPTQGGARRPNPRLLTLLQSLSITVLSARYWLGPQS